MDKKLTYMLAADDSAALLADHIGSASGSYYAPAESFGLAAVAVGSYDATRSQQ